MSRVRRLTSNDIGISGAKDLAAYIKSQNFRLTDLAFGNNKLSDRAVECVISALRNSRDTVQSLDMSHNESGDLTCQALNSLLQTTAHLKTLNCGWAHLRGPKVASFLTALTLCSSINTLDLRYTPLYLFAVLAR